MFGTRYALAGCLLFTAYLLQAQDITQKRIEVGGLNVNVAQAGSAEPVVVFIAGLGEDLSTWHSVQPQIAQFAGTFSYDRAGLGKSDPSPEGKSVEHMTSELHALLAAAAIPRPCVLVGHSLGGAIAELFAFTYPEEVAGLVLVDPRTGGCLIVYRLGWLPISGRHARRCSTR